jgi:hypothetical protein
VRKESGRGKERFKVRGLLADPRCSRPVLDFLSTTDVGRRAPPPAEDAENETPEWELRDRREREEETRVEAVDLPAEVEEPLFLPAE